MPSVTFIEPDGAERMISAAEGVSLMQAAVNAGVNGIVAECGGSAACATCHVYVDPAWADGLPPVDAQEDGLLDFTASKRRETSRLSCQIKLDASLDGMIVRAPPTQY